MSEVSERYRKIAEQFTQRATAVREDAWDNPSPCEGWAGASWIRVVGEAGWSGHTDDDIAMWTRYESLVNLAFASSPATIMCTYDEQAFPVEVVANAHRTHPQLAHGSGATASPVYREPEDFLLDA